MDYEFDDEIQSQLNRTAALIQEAYVGLNTIHSRMSEASSIHAQARTSAPSDPLVTSLLNRRDTPGEQQNRSTMDPGHDVIVIASSDRTTVPNAASTVPLSSSLTIRTTPHRRRPSDPTLATLHSEVLAAAQTFRDRRQEFNELRRAIAQYQAERRAHSIQTSSNSQRPVSNTSSLLTQVLRDRPSVARGGDLSTPEALSMAGNSMRMATRSPSIPGYMSGLNQFHTASQSATSLGLMVAARTTGNLGNADTDTPSRASTPTPSVHPPTTAPLITGQDRTPTPPVPAVIASRMNRLAQEFQQDIARIAQQGELLMSWINDRQERLNSSLPRQSSSTVTPAPRVGGDASAGPTRPVAESDPFPTETVPLFAMSPSSLNVTNAAPRATRALPRQTEQSTRSRVQPSVGESTPDRLRRTPEAAARTRYLRQSVPTGWSTTSPSASSPREERMPSWSTLRGREQPSDGPLFPPSRTITPPSSSRSTTDIGVSTRLTNDAPIEAIADTIARLRARRNAVSGENEEESTEWRSYHLTRRYNADGDEEVIRVTPRPEASPGFGETSTISRRVRLDPEELEEEDRDESWMQALSRLDALQSARQTGTRWELPRMTRSGAQMGTVVDPSLRTSGQSPVNPTRLLHLFGGRGDNMSVEEDSEYERDLEAMRARARALLSSTAPPRSLGGTALPPPPPTTRPLSFVPTTQGTPGSLWNDESVRVRLRGPQNDDARRVLDPNAEYPAFRIRTLRSVSPSPERSARLGRDRHGPGVRFRDQRERAANKDLERPVWGSPTPFCPSPLPLPLVGDVGSLQVRSRVFSSAKQIARMPPRRAVAQAGC